MNSTTAEMIREYPAQSVRETVAQIWERVSSPVAFNHPSGIIVHVSPYRVRVEVPEWVDFHGSHVRDVLRRTLRATGEIQTEVLGDAIPLHGRTVYETGYRDMDSVRAANERSGHYFFSPSTLRFFDSRVGGTLYGGRYFVTSESNFDGTERRYSVREVTPWGTVDTVDGPDGETTFNRYASRSGAHDYAKRLASILPA